MSFPFKDTSGTKSWSLTLMLFATLLAFVAFVASVLNLPIIRPISAGEIATFWAPFGTLYFGRRWTNTGAPTTAPTVPEQ